MLKIRLSRSGAKKAPFYRIVVVEARSKTGGKPLEVLGTWNPRHDQLFINRKKIEEWRKTNG